MKRVALAACVTAALSLTACGPEPTQEMFEQTRNAKSVAVEQNPRVLVSRIGVFRDDLAYHDKRGIYLIKDTLTGLEFIGISGVGITEVGRHGGKHSRSDEQ